MKTHTPVQLSLKAGASSFRGLYLRQPPRLPQERLYGPLLPQPVWEPALTAARRAAEAALEGGAEAAADLIDEAYALWAKLAEEELQDITGCVLPKAGLRACRPRMVWRSILGDLKPKTDKAYPKVAVLVWLRGSVAEVVRVAGEMAGTRRIAHDGDDTAATANDQVGGGVAHGHQEAVHEEWSDDELPGDAEAGRNGPSAWLVLDEIHCALHDDIPRATAPPQVAARLSELAEVLATMRGWRDGGLAQWESGRERALRLLEEPTVEPRQEEAEMERRELAGWRDWLNKDADAGARNAHLYSRLPEEWRPDEVVTERGTVSADPAEFLQDQRNHYKAK